MLKASVCISTFNKPTLLEKTLESIFVQTPPFEFEVIVVDDGSATNEIREVCSKFPVRYRRIDRDPVFRNPCTARNVAYKLASSDVIIAQSDEVLHVKRDTIEKLVETLEEGKFVMANVFCLSREGKICGEFIGATQRRPRFFLGALYRRDLFAIGGNDEDFAVSPAWEDAWFGDCLMRGLNLKPVYTTDIVGYHQYHGYVSRPELEVPSRNVYLQKFTSAVAGDISWQSASGPWLFIPAIESDAYLQKMERARVEALFTAMYQENYWGSRESRSGNGSTEKATRKIRKVLPGIISQYHLTTMLDIPCGDFNWMQLVPMSIQYTGADIVAEIVSTNRITYGDKFKHLNLLYDELPCVDLIFCRDCLGHFSISDLKRAILNIIKSGSRYLFATTFPRKENNRTIRTGQWTPYNLQAKPIGFPNPILAVNENCQECYPSFTDKSMGLWLIADLKGIIND